MVPVIVPETEIPFALSVALKFPPIFGPFCANTNARPPRPELSLPEPLHVPDTSIGGGGGAVVDSLPQYERQLALEMQSRDRACLADNVRTLPTSTDGAFISPPREPKAQPPARQLGGLRVLGGA